MRLQKAKKISNEKMKFDYYRTSNVYSIYINFIVTNSLLFSFDSNVDQGQTLKFCVFYIVLSIEIAAALPLNGPLPIFGTACHQTDGSWEG